MAIGNFATTSAGSVCKPKNTKKTAANTSRKGAIRMRIASASSPVISSPTKNAATAEEKSNMAATPPANSASPNVVSNKDAPLSALSKNAKGFPPRAPTNSSTATTNNPDPTPKAPERNDAAPPMAASTGRYGAITKSSNTKIVTSDFHSGRDFHPISRATCVAIPLLDTYVIPAIATTNTTFHPSSKAMTAPGIAFKNRSTTAVFLCSRTSLTIVFAENSRPRKSNNMIAPTSAATPINGCEKSRSATPPTPKPTPARRNNGALAICSLTATRAMIPRRTNTPPSSATIRAVSGSTKAANTHQP